MDANEGELRAVLERLVVLGLKASLPKEQNATFFINEPLKRIMRGANEKEGERAYFSSQGRLEVTDRPEGRVEKEGHARHRALAHCHSAFISNHQEKRRR